ncbi:MAG TPA: peptidyl-prolyl cis-trans isomerase [Candidatus Polarisedimenticolia bacterium]|jgi:peptidyl-prolyl cis-trans isomerase SurA|nr:peptidyl-prolyl cis-trans isomerase [Candidatus Polarisedimenticolia bacterium]
MNSAFSLSPRRRTPSTIAFLALALITMTGFAGLSCSKAGKGADASAAPGAGGTQAAAGGGGADSPGAQGPGAVAKGDQGAAVATVGDRKITYRAFERYLNDNAGEDEGEGDQVDAFKSRLLDQFLEEQLLLKEAERLEVAVSDAEVDAYLKELGVSEDDVDVGTPDGKAAFRARVKDGLLVQKVKEKAVLKTIKVAPGEVDDELKKHPEAAASGSKVVLRQILLEDKNAAEEARRLILAEPAKFEEVARAKSGAPDKGAPRAYDEQDLPEDLRTAVAALKPGEISPVVEQSKTFVLLKLDRRVEAAPSDAAEARHRVESELFRQKADQVMERYIADLKEKTAVRVIRALLPFRYVGEFQS